MKVIILARVSTEEQKEAGNSLPAQQVRLKNYVKQSQKLNLDKEFIFDESAYKEHREEFQKVIEYVSSFKEVVALCCDKVDRLTRDFLVGLPALERLRRDGKVELHFPGDNLVLHKDSPATDLFHFNIAVSLAQYYSNSISDNVKRAYEQKHRQGQWTGKAPLGYKNITDDKGNHDIELDPERSHLVKKMFELYATGNYSIETVKVEMDKLGLTGSRKGKLITTSTIYRILTNPFYFGIMEIKGVQYPHKYESLISRYIFEKCREVMDSYNKKPFKSTGHPFIFKGLIHCAICGCTVTPELKKNGKFIYYSCTNYKKMHKRVWVNEKELLKPVYNVLGQIQMPQDKIDYVVDGLRKTGKSEAYFHKRNMTVLKTDYDRVEERIEKMYEDKLDGRITSDMYDKKLKQYKEQQAEMLDKMQAHSDADQEFYVTANTVLNLAKRALEIFESSEPAEKRQFLNYLLQNCLLNGKKLEFTIQNPFNTIIATQSYPLVGA